MGSVGYTDCNISGQVVTFGLGNLANLDGDNTQDETIEITYEVRVRNVLGNQTRNTTQQ